MFLTTHNTASHPGSRNTRVALYLIWTLAAMVAITYAAVPVYKLYVKVTGYDGTGSSATIAPGTILSRKVTLTFDSNVAPGLPWSFKPLQPSQIMHIGEVELARFRVQNNAKTPVTGVASFNITPFESASYFRKIHCFCFTKQTLGPGETRDFAVSYFVDPKLDKDKAADDVKTMTLSYTFFRRDDLAVDK
ncbi:MAG: cytochrome c oxidase assembly protein [Alphaproteobacteria bacterium]